MGYGYRPEPDVLGFIDRETILSKYGEERVFSMVFGEVPRLYEYVLSPFREDANPGCYFQISPSGQLRFVDFGNKDTLYGIKMNNIDCFNAVQVFYGIPNFYLTLKFIEQNLGKLAPKNRRKSPKLVRKRMGMGFTGRNFVEKDAQYWQSYGISRKNLISDGVFPVSEVIMDDFPDMKRYRVKETCYAYTGFGDRMKFYFPFRTSGKRFITNCTPNDIGGVEKLPPYGRQLVYTKSYKDMRVLKNSGESSVWNQNEGMEPDDDVLMPIVKRFDKVVVLYDNDRQGMEASLALAQRINRHFPHRARPLWVPEQLNGQGITDPSDLIRHSRTDYMEFLKNLSIR